MSALLALALALLTPAPGPLYAGYEQVEGQREVPVLGTLRTRRHTWFLARFEPDGAGGRVLRQRACAVRFEPAKGAVVRLPDRLLARLPASRLELAPAEGGWRGAAQLAGWGEEDLDEDGQPGATIEVDAPLCGGALYVAHQTRSDLTARARGAEVVGEITIEVAQRVLGARGACLRELSEDGREVLRGRFRMVPVAPDATCARLPAEAWPRSTEG